MITHDAGLLAEEEFHEEKRKVLKSGPVHESPSNASNCTGSDWTSQAKLLAQAQAEVASLATALAEVAKAIRPGDDPCSFIKRPREADTV